MCRGEGSMKKLMTYIIPCAIIPAVVAGGVLLFGEKQYAWISLCVAILACIPFFIGFERRKRDSKELIMIAAMVALSVIGRIIFTPFPGFKPVTAMVVITAMYFGSEAGFMTGALSAVISNFSFGQGPWTPFQMFSWGIIGLIAGLISKQLKSNKIVLSVYAVISGALYSCLMDIWSVIWADGYFNISRYIASVVSAIGFTVIYAVSNVIFLLAFSKPIGKILERLKTKYGLFE